MGRLSVEFQDRAAIGPLVDVPVPVPNNAGAREIISMRLWASAWRRARWTNYFREYKACDERAYSVKDT